MSTNREDTGSGGWWVVHRGQTPRGSADRTHSRPEKATTWPTGVQTAGRVVFQTAGMPTATDP